ncbi:MAG: methyltransferase domain-containing protein [Verrucomicrobia bacterium]|nr:methyltransferase domain-containing protein [Verrucomicrobiota bacterium]
MGFLTPSRRFAAEPTDYADVPPAMLVENLHDIARFNHRFGGIRAVLQPLQRLIQRTRPQAPITVLDLGTGSADIPRAIVCWARAGHLPLRVTAVDVHPVMVEMARKECIEFPQIAVERQDLLALPYPAGSFDFVISSLVLHCFADKDVVQILNRANRIARHGVIMSDLRRGRLGCAVVWLGARLVSRNPLTRQEAPAAVLNAFTPRELLRLAERAGVRSGRVLRQRGFRVSLVWSK